MSVITHSDLEIFEARDEGQAFPVREGAIRDDGTVDIVIIRPGLGNKAHKHYYSRDMLRENAGVFKGWPMYVDHLAESARRALGGLPRSIRDIGGKVLESWWDDSIPADDRHEAGGVVGRVRPLGYMRHLVDEAPELVRTSIAASATGVRPTTYRGNRAYAVEGIAASGGSVDWVTEAGAGGRVVGFIAEAAVSDYTADFFDSLSDDDMREWLTTYRPTLAEAVLDQRNSAKGGDMPEGITTQALEEALRTDDGRSLVESLVREALRNDDRINEIVEARIEEEREVIVREAQARADRQLALRDMRDEAHSLIEAARLPEALATASKAKFNLVEGRATDGLDIVDDLDDDLKVTRTAREKLVEAVQAEITSQRELAASLRPTRVSGQGRVQEGSRRETDGEGDGEGEGDGKTPLVDAMLRESGFGSAAKEVYAGR